VKAIRQQVASALDMVVHLARLQDGSRRVTSVTEVQGMESDVITMQELFEFKIDSFAADGTINGGLRSTGLRPIFVKKFERHGIELPTSLFREGAEIGQTVDLAARIAQGSEAR
jgi:pilus assembly protein CpaF